MKDTLEEYFNVNDTLDTLKGGNGDTLETEKKIAVAVTEASKNTPASTTPVIEEKVEGEKPKPSNSGVSPIEHNNNENNENDNDNENENEVGSEFNEVLLIESMKELESENSVIQTHLYFRFFELYNIDRLSKLSSKIKTHYGINSLNVLGDQNNKKMKLSNSFMDTIYFCFLSSNANRKFWNVLFDRRKYSKFLDDRFNNENYETESDIDIEFEDLDKKLYEILFNVKNDREENSYELMLEFIYTVKKNLKSQGDISIEDFFNHLKTETVYVDRLIKNKLKQLKLRINNDDEKSDEVVLPFKNYIANTIPDNIDKKSIRMIFNGGEIGLFDLNEKKESFFNKLDDIIKRETGIELNELKERRNNKGNFFKYNLEFIEKYFIDYFDGFSLHNEKKYKYAVVEDSEEEDSEYSSEDSSKDSSTTETNSGLGNSKEVEKTKYKKEKKKRKGRKLVPFNNISEGGEGDGEEKAKRQYLLKLLLFAKKIGNKELISKILGMLRKLKKGKTKGSKFGSDESVEQVELTVEQQSLYDLLKKYINDKLEFSLEQVLKLYYDIYILNDELKGLNRFAKLEDLKNQVVGLESRIRLAYPEHRHNQKQISQFVDSFVTTSKKDKYKITSEFHTLTFLICILLNVKINKDGVDGYYNWGLGIVKTEGLNDYSATDMSSILKLCEVLYALIQKLRRANNDKLFLNYFYSRHKDDNYNGWFRYEELKKFLKKCVEGKTILDCLVSQNAFITEENKLSSNLAVYVALSVIHSKKSQTVSRPLPQTPASEGKTVRNNGKQKPILPSKKTIEEEFAKKNEIIESVFSIYNQLSKETFKTEQTGGYYNELNLEEIGGYFKKTTTSMYPPFFFTGNSGVVDVSSASKKDNIDENCFGPKQKGIFSKLFNEDSKRAPMLRDKYMTTLQESSGKKICYPTLMTDPYEGKYHEFYWGFRNINFIERPFSNKFNEINFYKLNLNNIQFAFNEEESYEEIFVSLEKFSDTIDKYKGIYTEMKKKDGKLKTFGKGVLALGKGIGTLGYLTGKEIQKKRNEKKLKFLKEYDESRERDENMPTNRYLAYMKRLSNLYFQQILFDEMITIEQSMKHLVQYYQLRKSYLGIESVTKLSSQISAPVTPVIPVTIPRSVSVSPVSQGEFRSRANTFAENAAAMTARDAGTASVVSEGSATPTITPGIASNTSISLASTAQPV